MNASAWLRPLVAALVVMAVAAAAPAVTASHTSPATLSATASASSEWSNAQAALVNDGAYASTNGNGADILISSFSTGGASGAISSVEIRLDVSQQSHSNDRLSVSAQAAGCSAVSPSPSSFEPTSSRATRTISLSCQDGWTWAKVAGLEVEVTTDAQSDGLLGLSGSVDGQWRLYYASLRVAFSNSAPIASAGADQAVSESTPVTLHGAASSDPDGETLSYSWSQSAGASVALSGASTGTPQFTAPALASNAPVTLTFTLTVSDSSGHQGQDAVDVLVSNNNQPPVASAGPDVSVTAGEPVTLDGADSSDPDGDALSYAWSQTSGMIVTLSGAASATPSFTAPSSAGTLTFELSVADGHGGTGGPDTVMVTVSTTPGESPAPSPSPVPDGGSGGGGEGDDAPDDGGPKVPLRVHLVPATLVMGPGQRAAVAVTVEWSDGSATRPATGCAWDAGLAGGLWEAVGGACSGTLVAGETSGTGYRLAVTWSDAGTSLSADTDVTVAATAVAELDENMVCAAEVPSTGERALLILFDASCGVPVDRIVLEPADPKAGLVTVEVRPGEVAPALLSGAAAALGFSVEARDASGAALVTRHVDLWVRAEPSWLDSACPDAGCTLAVFHEEGDAWVRLEAVVEESGDGYVVRAESEHLSRFALAGIPTAAAGAGEPAVSWLAWWPWGLAAAAALAAFVVVGVMARRRSSAQQAVLEAGQQPSARKAGLAAPSAPSLTGLMDELHNEELVQFLNNAAHDLASPLTPIKLQLAILDRAHSKSLTEPQKKALAVVARNIEHMGMLVGDLKEASRIQAGRFQMFPEAIDLVDVVKQSVESFREQATAAGVAMSSKSGAQSLPVHGDRGRFVQVLYNLVGNAVKFTPKDGHVRVEAHVKDGQAVVLVRDTGLGLSPEDAAQLFKPFSQVHSATEKKKGSGLGLYICKGIVEGHGGKIWCESPGPGKGTTFAFTVPLLAEAPAPAPADQNTLAALPQARPPARSKIADLRASASKAGS